jgi:hypothetical protein
MSTTTANPALLGDIAKVKPESLHHVQTAEKNALPSKEGKCLMGINK